MIPDSWKRKVAKGDVEGEIDYFSSFEDIMRQKKSPLQKYQHIFIGNNSLGQLTKFELITTLCGTLPGILGYKLRDLFYPLIFNKVGKGSVFGRNVTLRHASKINVGQGCVIDEYCMLSAQGSNRSAIMLGNEVLLSRGTVLSTRNGSIEIGDFSNIGANCRLGTTSKIQLGRHVLVAANCYIGGAQHKFDRLDVPISRQGFQHNQGVTIEDDVWLGAGTIVLDGVKIGTGSVIGAGSLVNKSLQAYSVAAGIPAATKAFRKDQNIENSNPVGAQTYES